MCDAGNLIAGNLIAGNGGCLIPAGPEVGVAFFHVVVHDGEPVFYRGARRKRKDSAKRFGKKGKHASSGTMRKSICRRGRGCRRTFQRSFSSAEAFDKSAARKKGPAFVMAGPLKFFSFSRTRFLV